jgi:HAE1 family hydrophobic/amphiphilic exporter-1
MIRLSMRRPVAVSMAYLAVALLGIAAWRNIPIELLPDTELPRLTVSAAWRNASPEAMEAFVTAPLETAVQQVRGVRQVTSVSDEQYGSAQATISIEFARDTDMDFARLDLSERLAALEDDLPPGVRPRVEPYTPEEFREQQRPFLSYTLSGPYTLEALRAHLDDDVVPELLQVEGVAGVEARGGRERLIEVVLDETRINALGLDPIRVRQKIAELEYVSEAGAVEDGRLLRTLAIRHRTESLADVRRAPLLTDRGRLVRVGDVATVHDSYEEPIRHYRVDGLPAVSFEVHKDIGVNTVAVADRVKALLAALEGAHPPGVRLILDEDESEAVRAQLTDLQFRALVAAAVIFAVLLLFLRSFRAAAIVFATIGFSILIAINLVYFGGLTLNVLTLMGLAMGFGLIVDNAIVVLENVYRRVREWEAAGGAGATGAAGGTRAAAGVAGAPKAAAVSNRRTAEPPNRRGVGRVVEASAREVVLPILAVTLTTLIVFVPFVYLQGELRVYYLPLAIVVGMSLLASLFVAFSFIPALAVKLLGAGGAEGAGGGAEAAGAAGAAGDAAPGRKPGLRGRLRLQPPNRRTVEPPGEVGAGARRPWYVRIYTSLLGATLRFPWVTVVLAAVILFGTYRLFDKHVTRGIIWRNWWGQETYVDVFIRLPRGELERTDELTRHFEERLRLMPDVERFVTRVEPQYAHIRVTFPDSLERTMVPVAIKEQMVAYSLLFGGAEVRVYGFGPSFYGGGGSPPSYSIQVAGYNYETVRAIAADLGRRLMRFSRIRDVDVNSSGRWYQRDKATEFVLVLDRQRLGLHRLEARDVVWQVAAAVWGQVRQDVMRLAGDEVRYEVKLAGDAEIDVLELHNLLLQVPGGRQVRLGDVAQLEEREVLNRIVREDQQYQRYVSYEFRGPTKLGDRVRDVVIAVTALPEGYRIEADDEWRWSAEEGRQIWGVLAVSLVLVFLVTAALFESLRQPLCVLLTVPMALVGVFLIFFSTDASFTREAYVGVIMMGGIVVNNAILLVDGVSRLRRAAGLPLREAIVQGTLQRVRPILMTSATTIFGLLPLVLFSESADANIWNALGYALIGGLASSTLFVLTVTPALYLLFERGPESRRGVA